MNDSTEGMKPIEKYKVNSLGIECPDAHYVCPKCGEWVGGYTAYGSGENEWGYERYKFCRECGKKIDWGGIK